MSLMSNRLYSILLVALFSIMTSISCYCAVNVNDESELIKAVADACVSGSREAVDCQLLRQGGEVLGLSELTELAQILEDKTLDSKNKHKIAAASALLQYCEQKYGEGSFQAIVSRRCYIAAAWMTLCPEVRKNAKKNAELAKTLSAKNPRNEQYKILELVTRLELISSSEPFDEDKPENWKELWNVIKEAAPFLENGRCDSQELIDLRSYIFNLRLRNTSYEDYALVYLMDSIFHDDLPKSVFDDIEVFLTQTWEGSKRLRGQDDFQTLNLEFQLLSLQVHYQLGDYNKLHGRINEIQKKMEAYYPEGDLNPVIAELLKWDCDIVYGKNMYELMSPTSVLQKIADFSGEESETYLTHLSQIMNQQLAVNPDKAAALCKEIRQLAEKMYTSSSDEYGYIMMNMFYAMQALSTQNPQLLQEYISDFSKYYRDHHRPTWLSISIGRNFSKNLSEVLKQFDLADEIYEISFNDLSQIVNKNSPLYAYCSYDKAQIQAGSSDPAIQQAAEQTFKETLHLFKQWHMGTAHICYYYSQLLFSHHKYQEAIKVIRQGISDCIPGKEDIWRCHLQMYLANNGLYNPSMSMSKKQIDELYQQAIPAFMQQTNHDGIFLDGFRMIGDYYREDKRYNEAEKIYQQGIEYAEHNPVNAQRQEYVLLISNLNSLYIYYMRDLDKAEQLMDGKIEALQNDPYFDRHDLLLQLMWDRYFMISSKADMMLRMNALISIQREIDLVIQRSGNNEFLFYQYYMPLVSEFISTFDSWSSSQNGLANASATDEASRLEIDLYRKAYSYQRETFKNQIPPILAFLEESLMRNNPDYLDDVSAIQLYSTMSDYYLTIENDTAKADYYLQKLTLSKEPYNRFIGLFSLAKLRTKQSKYTEAAQLLEQAKKTSSQITYGLNGIDSQIGFNLLMFSTYYLCGKYEEAIQPARDHFKFQQQIVQQNFDLLTQSERELFVNEKGGAGSDGLLLLLPHFPKRLSGECYDAQLAQKGLLLRASERIKRGIQESKDTELLAQLDTLNRMNMRLKSMNMGNSITDGSWQFESASYNPEYISLKEQIEALERSINRRAAKSISGMNTPNWKQLQKTLRQGEAAIEFVVEDSYIGALVLLPTGNPQYVPLNQAENLWQELNAISQKTAHQRANALYREDRFHLFQRLWQPIESLLQDVKTVYFSPSGFLNELAFAAFKCNDKEYLSDRYDLHQMLSTGDLIELRKSSSNNKPKSATILGGIYYSNKHEQLAKELARASEPVAIEDERGAVIDEEETFGYLPFSYNEVKKLSKLFSDNHLSIKQGIGFEPTEKFLSEISGNSSEVLQLSTHGFFVTSNEIRTNKFLSRFPMSMYSSMQRCGLALVDANSTWDGTLVKPEDNDGIITANEVALLDLSTTRLAVLSACQTAIGDYSNEGVFGMHRGFKQAGVKSILATMWNVNDKSTARFMELFYQRWLSGTPMQQSFTEAVKALREEYPSPYYWAPFVLMDAEN